jgi:hypothetical protein
MSELFDGLIGNRRRVRAAKECVLHVKDDIMAVKHFFPSASGRPLREECCGDGSFMTVICRLLMRSPGQTGSLREKGCCDNVP